MALIFQQYMTPGWLQKNGKLNNSTKVDIVGNVLVLEQPEGLTKGLLSVKLQDHMTKDAKSLLSNNALTFSIEISFDHPKTAAVQASTRPLMHRIYVLLADPKNRSAVGFRIEGDPGVYSKVGPYCGVAGTIGSNGDSFGVTTTSPTETRVVATTFPQVFRMLVRPGKNWGSIYASLDSGNLYASNFSGPIQFSNSQASLSLFSDDSADRDVYRVNYIDVSIYKED